MKLLLEFIKSMYFESNLKIERKKIEKKKFHIQLIFMDKKIYFKIEIRLTLTDRNEILPMKLSEFKILHFVDSYEKKNC